MGKEEIISEIEFVLPLLEPPAFKVRPKALSFKKSRFSGIWAEYRPEWSRESVDVFIPHNELKRPYFLRSVAEELIRKHTIIEVYPLRIKINKESPDPEKWRIPIFTMFSSDDRAAVVTEAEKVKLIASNIEEINIKKGTIIERRDFKLEVIDVEYHQEKKRPIWVVFKIIAPSKFPVVRQEQEEKDLQKWKDMPEHSEKKSLLKIKRFFYKRYGKNKVKIGEIEIILLPFFSEREGGELRTMGYVGKLKIVYPQPIDL